jgi:hypothetical protein
MFLILSFGPAKYHLAVFQSIAQPSLNFYQDSDLYNLFKLESRQVFCLVSK